MGKGYGGKGGNVIPIEVSDMAVRSGETDAERDFEESKNHGHLLCRRRHFFCSILRPGATQTERGMKVGVPLVLLPKSFSHQASTDSYVACGTWS